MTQPNPTPTDALREKLAKELCLIDHNGDEDAWTREGLSAQRGYNMMAKAAMSMLIPPAPAVSEASVDPTRWRYAKLNTACQRSQVQGFLYDTPKGAKTDKPKHHVVRDCLKRPGDQVIWSAFGDDEDYKRLDAKMSEEIELYCIGLIAKEYAALGEGGAHV